MHCIITTILFHAYELYDVMISIHYEIDPISGEGGGIMTHQYVLVLHVLPVLVPHVLPVTALPCFLSLFPGSYTHQSIRHSLSPTLCSLINH